MDDRAVNAEALSFAEALSRGASLYVDAGVNRIRIQLCDSDGNELKRISFPSSEELAETIKLYQLDQLPEEIGVYLTGKLQETISRYLGRGERVITSAALWSTARSLVQDKPLAIIELSASGYVLIGIDAQGDLLDDMLVVNPRCGAGSGVNIDRVLQKLNIKREQVDTLLGDYLGEAGRENRQGVNIRSDRCGVFAASATISDKNQGIPLDFALAVTLKSEVLKACKKLNDGFHTVWLTGGIFHWQYARDCAKDYLESIGVQVVDYDSEGSFPLRGLQYLRNTIGDGNFTQPDRSIVPPVKLSEYPALRKVKEALEARHLYHRIENSPRDFDLERLKQTPLLIGLDVGSTMAKLMVSDLSGEETLYKGAYSNAGDTIDTIKKIFAELRDQGIERLQIGSIGITGSARFQVKKALTNIYPELADRVSVLVENYAHARGSIGYAREHIERLKAAGVEDINEEICLLVDIGGEDTKVSSIALGKAELFDNAMNVKCSAGTGSLNDTLTAMFFLDDIAEAGRLAFNAERAYVINATCAVFLMENARKLQAEGYGVDEILASANWAIVENMARSLWNQIEMPKRTITLLHGQTMLGDPLPLAVSDRIQKYIGGDTFCLVPPDPGHRACVGLIKSMVDHDHTSAVEIELDAFIEKDYSKKIVVCKGAVCGDAEARCNRSHLTGLGDSGKKFSFSLGGCTAINEVAVKAEIKTARASTDTYKQIWGFINERLPHSEDENRLVIPRSFAVSEWAMFFASLFSPMDIPIHVDNVIESDILNAQPHFHIDTCAPHVGVVGQFLRLASQPHGMILAPQIEYLPVKHSMGRTCTINQGGYAVGRKVAEAEYPDARMLLFNVDLKSLDAGEIAAALFPQLQPVLEHYGKSVTFDAFRGIVAAALDAQAGLKREAADFATGLAREAMEAGHEVALVVGREYILNPGIYDSHVGRLLRDKNMVGIPSYLLDADFNPDFKHLYWRNPHLIATLADACAKRELHKVIGHEGLREIFARVEGEADTLVPVVQVSTFLCGPDSVTTPLVSELTRRRPYLLIQSDAVIKELAHLENRMNTYVKQLESGLYEELSQKSDEEFEVKVLDRFVNEESINRETDAVYFPTLSDHRVLTSVLRGAGFTCVDLYDEDYNLQAAIKEGRSMSGDSVCAPLAAVYGDIRSAIADFKQRKEAGEPEFVNKKRVLVFNNKGTGPCRQGQYVETHKIFHNQNQRSGGKGAEDFIAQFLVAHESAGYSIGVPEWAFVRAIQGVVLQGVLHYLLAEGASRCRDHAHYKEFITAYREFKQEIYRIQEQELAPSKLALGVAALSEKFPGISNQVKYFCYGLHRDDLTRPLKQFASKWCSGEIKGTPIRIHVDGEAYMRVAQYEEINETLLATLGFGQFTLTHAPIWSYFDYILTAMIQDEEAGMTLGHAALERAKESAETQRLEKEIAEKQKKLKDLTAVHHALREVLAAPLYRAAGLEMPEAMPEVMKAARPVIPTSRPEGELVPYVGEALLKLQHGYDLVINVAPEGCMVSSMGESITPGIYATANGAKGKVQHLFSQQGDVDKELIAQALLKTIGPVRYYQAAEAVLA